MPVRATQSAHGFHLWYGQVCESCMCLVSYVSLLSLFVLYMPTLLVQPLSPLFRSYPAMLPVGVLGEGGWGTPDNGDGGSLTNPRSTWWMGSHPLRASYPATVCTCQIRWLRAVADTNLQHKNKRPPAHKNITVVIILSKICQTIFFTIINVWCSRYCFQI